MRDRYLNGFDSIWIDSLNGDKYRTGKVTPDGVPDPSAFTTNRNREGIQVGTAVATMLCKRKHRSPAEVLYRDFWGATKLKELEAFGKKWSAKKYEKVIPIPELALPFRPMTTELRYTSWPLIPNLFPTYFTGVKTSRDEVVVAIDKESLVERMMAYFDPKLSHEQMQRISPRALEDATRFAAIETREFLQKRGFKTKNVVPFTYRPFDTRWLYWEPETKLLDEKRSDYVPHVFAENYWIAAVQQNRKEYDPPPSIRHLASLHMIERGTNVFPMLLRDTSNGHSLFGEDTGRICHELGDHCVNLSDTAITYLSTRGGVKSTPHLFFHTVAVLHSPTYASENADALRQDWPRVPLPIDAKLLRISAVLGRQVTSLLDPESKVAGINEGKTSKGLGIIATLAVSDGSRLNLEAGDLEVKAGWSHQQQNKIMPGPGKAIERPYTPEEKAALGDGIALLGATTFDIYLNDKAYWKNIPANVWSYTLGGYQVIKKWLSYREFALLGRALTVAEVEHVRDVARRIAALRLLGPELDANYEAVKADLFAWPGS